MRARPRGAGVALGAVLAASTIRYQVWYRNPTAFCTPATSNATNGLRIAWAN